MSPVSLRNRAARMLHSDIAQHSTSFTIPDMFAFLPCITIIFMISTIAKSFQSMADGEEMTLIDDINEELRDFSPLR